MKMNKKYHIPLLLGLLLLTAAPPLGAAVYVQCPGDSDGDAVPEIGAPGYDPNVRCMHLSGGDGFATMADGKTQYIFSFADLTGVPPENAMAAGSLAAALPAPLIAVNEGEEFFLTLTNVGMLIRPDLFDPHTVHFHGFPNAAAVFDGLPESGLSIGMGASLTYYYNLVEPGTFMYHCHVEATEHMQMGMLGNLYVRARQSWEGYPLNGVPAGNQDECNVPGDQFPGIPCGYAYNDTDGSTAYDVEFPLQLGGFDPQFHDDSWFVQPLPFAYMEDRYPLINGRGYPDTVNPLPLAPPVDDECGGNCTPEAETASGFVEPQGESSLITAAAGEKILLRLSNLNITVTHTLISPSIPMKVVAIDSRELRSADGAMPLHYTTNSVTLGGGMATDAILDTSGVPSGTYYLFAANLNYLSNDNEDFGGMMTEIRITP